MEMFPGQPCFLTEVNGAAAMQRGHPAFHYRWPGIECRHLVLHAKEQFFKQAQETMHTIKLCGGNIGYMLLV
jgi:hypothetical protein